MSIDVAWLDIHGDNMNHGLLDNEIEAAFSHKDLYKYKDCCDFDIRTVDLIPHEFCSGLLWRQGLDYRGF